MKKGFLIILLFSSLVFAASILSGCNPSCETGCETSHSRCLDDAKFYIANTALYNTKVAACDTDYQSCISSCRQ